uniref:Uncharacterized protein n=1 Tax=Panstrongylus lignarius TaxID=156445 RepID=A0A224Y0D7_9HEMI
MCFTSSLVSSMKFLRLVNSLLSILNLDGFFSTIAIVSSKSSKSHSILLSAFLNSVVVHSSSSFEILLLISSCTSSQRRNKPLVLFKAFATSSLTTKNGSSNVMTTFNKNYFKATTIFPGI